MIVGVRNSLLGVWDAGRCLIGYWFPWWWCWEWRAPIFVLDGRVLVSMVFGHLVPDVDLLASMYI